jgi:signal transduction histidine kinase
VGQKEGGLMELDKRIVESANVIMRTANTLLTEDNHLSKNQRIILGYFPLWGERLIEINNRNLSLSLPTDEAKRQDMIRAVAHDLRTPISLFINGCDFIEEDKSAWSSTETAIFIHIRNHIQRIMEIIDQL